MTNARGTAVSPDMVVIRGNRFTMGSADFYPDEAPPYESAVATFEIGRAPVTNAEFAHFVTATGYVTTAERELDPAEFPHLDTAARAPGSLVFEPTAGPVDLSDWHQWWRWAPGACWRHPSGPGSDIVGKALHPVVQVTYVDAVAYTKWAGCRLPTEAEHEYAAQGGHGETPDRRPYAWGRERDPDGEVVANTWHGRFPYENLGALGWKGTSPAGAFPPNPYGVYDLIGNVWEWTSDHYVADRRSLVGRPPSGPNAGGPDGSCCAPSAIELAVRSSEPGSAVPRRAIKGGSHLCAPEYCERYRPAARSAQAEDSSTSHIGFRCARDAA